MNVRNNKLDETKQNNIIIENNLKKITQTYDFNGNIINTDFLYFNYNNAYVKSSKRINIIINQINQYQKLNKIDKNILLELTKYFIKINKFFY